MKNAGQVTDSNSEARDSPDKGDPIFHLRAYLEAENDELVDFEEAWRYLRSNFLRADRERIDFVKRSQFRERIETGEVRSFECDRSTYFLKSDLKTFKASLKREAKDAEEEEAEKSRRRVEELKRIFGYDPDSDL